MTDDALPPCSIVVLAGGRGTRMGGLDKGLVTWRGKPLIAWLEATVRPLTDQLIVSCNRNQTLYAGFADRLTSDAKPEYPGPLAGIRAALALASQPLLLVVPCDMPLIDRALIEQLRSVQSRTPDKPAMVRHGEEWEPLICLIPKALGPAVDSAWLSGERSPRRLLRTLGATALQVADDDPRLLNLNTLTEAPNASISSPAPGKKNRDKPL